MSKDQLLSQVDFRSLESSAYGTDFHFTGKGIGEIITSLLTYLFPLAGILMLLYFLYGGFHLMVSRGDPKAVAEARGKITNAVIGFVIIFLAYWIVQIIAQVLGLSSVLSVFQ